MSRTPGTDQCPVASFLKLQSHLNPCCNSLWQRPRDSFTPDDVCWFYNKPVGVDTLRRFMKELSTMCHLSQIYTNHSIRVTGATILSQEHFGPKQIMSVTGHKSVSSLAIYQRISNMEKLRMGQTLGTALGVKSTAMVPVSPVPASPQHTGKSMHWSNPSKITGAI